MLQLLATLIFAVSYGSSGARIDGAAVSASDVLQFRAGRSAERLEIYLRAEAVALHQDCAAADVFVSPDCVSSKLLVAGIRHELFDLGTAPIGVAAARRGEGHRVRDHRIRSSCRRRGNVSRACCLGASF